MKLLVLGAGGLLGRHLVEEARLRKFDLMGLSHHQLDLTDTKGSELILDSFRPQVVINAAALCDFAACERDPAASQRINLAAPLWWSQQSRQRGFQLVLFSSDYIFDGKKGTPYTEEDTPAPLNVYGQHKAALEQAVGPNGPELICRPAWIFGRGGKTFMSLLPHLLQAKPELQVASGKRGSCLHAGCGARAILDLVSLQACGLYNLVQPGSTSWEDFAALCWQELKQMGLHPACQKISLMPFEQLTAQSSGQGQRPSYSVLAPDKLLGQIGPLPSWQDALRTYLAELDF
jgi:dTDP-4-dehydrorhamnose reductase